MTEITKFRYPGAKNFTTEQAHLFMGRDDDKEKLYQMIAARQIVVLYGKSGMGKSSLLNAGIIPLLDNELSQKPKYFSVRLFNKGQESNATFVPPLQTLIKTVLENATEKEWLKPLKADVYPKGELWYWLKQWQIAYPRVPIILFFDQFEELFSYSDTEIEEFGEELRTLIYQNIPDYISKSTSLTAFEQTAFAQQSEKEREEKEKQIDAIYEKIDIKLVFSIRSDRMALLNKLTKYIPNILKHFYELDALTEEAAKEAIRIPAQIEGDFQTPTFQYEDKVVDAIIKRVKNKHDGKIETATLQIICRFIELQKVSHVNSIITLNDLGNIKDIFKDFYQTSLNKLNKEEKAIASKTIEERFIQNNQRIPFAGESLKLEDKWTDSLLQQLEESTLLRKERDTAGRFIYEIGHDTLIEPIVEFAKDREQSNKRKRFISFLSIGLIVILGLLGVIFYMFSLNNRATALYWASEADKLNPIQKIALLEEALYKTNDSTALSVIREVFEETFNQSNEHQWQEKRRFEDIVSADFSLDGKWLITIGVNHNYKVWSLASGKYYDFLKGEETISEATFSPDSKWLITTDDVYSNSRVSKVWSVESGKQADFLKEEKTIHYATFSQDGKWLTTEDDNNTYKVWSLASKKQADFLKEEKNIDYAIFSPDSKWLITEDVNDNSKVWSVASGKQADFLKEEKSTRSATFSEDGKWLITSYVNGNYKVWSVASGKQADFLKGEKEISYAYFSPDSKWLITKYPNDNYKVWSLASGKHYDFLKREKTINNATFSEDSKWLITRDFNYNYKVWSLASGKQYDFLKEEKEIRSADFSQDSKLLITRNLDNTWKVWSLASGKQVDFLKEEKTIHNATFSEDGKWLITRNVNGTYKVWSIASGKQYDFLKEKKTISMATFSPDSKWLTTRDDIHTSKVWSVASGKQADFLKEEKWISCATFSPDSKWLITSGINDNPKIWSVEKRILYNFLKGKATIDEAHFSPDSKWLITSDMSDIPEEVDGNFKAMNDYSQVCWSVASGKQADFLKVEKRIRSATFSQDSKWLITKNDTDTYKVWSLASGKQADFLKKEQTIIYADFSPDGKWLFTITRDESYNNNYKVWSVASGKQYDFLKEETGIVLAGFSPDSKLLITTSDFSYLSKVWSVASGKYYDFLKEEERINSADFSPDSKWLITRYKNGTYKVWSVASGKYYDFLKGEATIGEISFSKDSKLLSFITNHKVKTYEIATGKLVQTLWLNKVPTDIDIIDNRYLYVIVGKAIVKTDLQTQQGNLMSFGDGEPLDYQYDEIVEWQKVFGDKYLLPLEEEMKKKYGIKQFWIWDFFQEFLY